MKRRSPPPEPAADNSGDSVYLVYSRNGLDRENGEAKRKSKSARKKKKNLQNELNQVMS